MMQAEHPLLFVRYYMGHIVTQQERGHLTLICRLRGPLVAVTNLTLCQG